MRKALLTGIFLFTASQGWCAYALVQSTGSFRTTAVLAATTTVNVSVNNLISSQMGTGSTTINPKGGDSLGNTWFNVTCATNSLVGITCIYYSVLTSGGAKDGIRNTSTSSTALWIGAQEYSGNATSTPVDVSTTSQTGGNTFVSSTFTTTTANDQVAVMCQTAGSATSITAGVSNGAAITATSQFSGNGNREGDFNTTTAQTYWARCNTSASVATTIVVAAYKPAAAVVTTTVCPSRSLLGVGCGL